MLAQIFTLLAVLNFSTPAQATLPVIDVGGIAATLGVGTIVTGFQTALTALLNYLNTLGFSAVAAATNAQSIIQGKIQELIGNFQADTAMYVPVVTYSGAAAARAVLPNQSTVCQNIDFYQAKARMAGNPLGMAESFVQTNNCKGPLADCTGPKRVDELFHDACQLGFLSEAQFGDLPQNAQCKTYGTYPSDQSYVDRDEQIGSVLDYPQMVLAQPCILPDGYPSFSPDATGCTLNTVAAKPTYDIDPGKSQLAWVAAYQFCEKLDLITQTTPTYSTSGRPINDGDKSSIVHDRSATSLRISSAKSLCRKYVLERTACPQGVDAKAIGMPDTCHDNQVRICNKLKNQPNPDKADVANGTYPTSGTTGVGFSGSQALANCDQYGLSELQAKYVTSHPCEDQAYMQARANRTGGSANANEEFASVTCKQLDDAYDDYIQKEYQALTNAVSASIAMRSSPAAGSGQPTGSAR